MNQNDPENPIRQLFRQLRLDDQQAAPPFDRTVLRRRTATGRGSSLRIALRVAAAAVLVAMLTGAWLWWNRAPGGANQEVADITPPPTAVPIPYIIEKPPAPPDLIKVTRAPRISKQARSQKTLITQWRSPTGFLLSSADDRWLKTVPRIDDSVVRIKTLGAADNN